MATLVASSVNPLPDAPGLIASLATEAVASQLLFDLQFTRECRRWQDAKSNYQAIACLCDEALLPTRTVLANYEAKTRIAAAGSTQVEGRLQLSALNAATNLLFGKRYRSTQTDSTLSVTVSAHPEV